MVLVPNSKLFCSIRIVSWNLKSILEICFSNFCEQWAAQSFPKKYFRVTNLSRRPPEDCMTLGDLSTSAPRGSPRGSPPLWPRRPVPVFEVITLGDLSTSPRRLLTLRTMADSLEKINNKLLVTYIFFFFKNSSSDREKLLKFKAEGREFEKKIEITRTIYSNSERSEQFSVAECFFDFFLEVAHI